jgi:hypothetical protein
MGSSTVPLDLNSREVYLKVGLFAVNGRLFGDLITIGG